MNFVNMSVTQELCCYLSMDYDKHFSVSTSWKLGFLIDWELVLKLSLYAQINFPH
jgi:hypothetical protein